MVGPVPIQPFADDAARLETWLFERALPLWWDTGADPRGGFYERIDQAGRPVEAPQRARTVARQVFSYCEAGRLGWRGPWREAARHALTRLTGSFLGDDGAAISSIAAQGAPVDRTFDLYNQAFALLALASAHQAFAGEAEWRARAVTLRETLRAHHAHPAGGYFEDRARKAAPLRSNPHMHLLESALAWASVDDDPAWGVMADDIVALCLGQFIDRGTGALREFFALDWSPERGPEGRVAEPGHHYEWAFLLDWWARLRNRPRPAAAQRLIAFADAHGVCGVRRVAMNALLVDGSVHDAAARLWPQTERLRAYTLTPGHPRLAEAIAGFEMYLQTPVAGLWYDRLSPESAFVDEPAPASSLYHIVGAIAALKRAARTA